MIPRLLEHSLASAWTQFPVVVLTGARQVGKTTLARQFLPEAGYVTLDVPAEAERARLNPADLFASQTSPLILDEVQYAPTLLRQLKIRVDLDRVAGSPRTVGSSLGKCGRRGDPQKFSRARTAPTAMVLAHLEW